MVAAFKVFLPSCSSQGSYLFKKATMRIINTGLIGFSLLFLIHTSCFALRPAAGNGIAVVELFTSEGCSSCPAAEAVLNQLHRDYGTDVYVMEFHVDYWNYIGWKDMYGSKEYTVRQQNYAARFGLGSSYTPQAVVNGADELVGSDKTKLYGLAKAGLQTPAANSITLTTKRNGRNISVKYQVANANSQLLNVAIVQKSAETKVRRGENSGKKLKHTNVVSVFKSLDLATTSGETILNIPDGITEKDIVLIAYTQMKGFGKITGAVSSVVE